MNMSRRSKLRSIGSLKRGQDGEKSTEKQKAAQRFDEDDEWSGPFFACPFYKLDPERYTRCLAKYELKRWADVKMHIIRCHKLGEAYCTKCYESFGSKDESDLHLNQDLCVARSGPETFSRSEIDGLANAPRGATNEVKWYWTWDNFFWHWPRPESPYVRDVINEVKDLFRPQFEASLAAQLEGRTDSARMFEAHLPTRYRHPPIYASDPARTQHSNISDILMDPSALTMHDNATLPMPLNFPSSQFPFIRDQDKLLEIPYMDVYNPFVAEGRAGLTQDTYTNTDPACSSSRDLSSYAGTYSTQEYQSTRPTQLNSEFSSERRFGFTHSDEPKTMEVEPAASGVSNYDQDLILDDDDMKTVYSAASSIESHDADDQFRGFAMDIFNRIKGVELGQETFERIPHVLPDLLKAFAIRVGYETQSQINRDTMYFVHRYRSDITRSFSQLATRDEKPKDSQEVHWKERIALWLNKADVDKIEIDEMSITGSDQGSEDDEMDIESAGLRLREYQRFVHSTEAYKWLMSRLNLELRLEPDKAKVIGHLRGVIGMSLHKRLKISKKLSPAPQNALFRIYWDLKAFLDEYQPNLHPSEAIGKIITLTGLDQDAQALTCEQYLTQTWPTTGKQMLRVIEELLTHESNSKQSACLSDGTKLKLEFQGQELIAEAQGTVTSITEVAEQLAWLASSICSSPRREGLVSSTAVIAKDETQQLPTFKINPVFEDIDTDKKSLFSLNGRCWHNLFLNPVITNGYPIIAKPEPSSGIEMPLKIMAALAGTQRIDTFNDQTFIKGFSVVLVPRRKHKGVLLWHMLFNDEGRRISYPRRRTAHAGLISRDELTSLRHVLGWCSNAELCAGFEGATYLVKKSYLESPHQSCPLAGMSVAPGPTISGGPNFVLCKKDTSLSVVLGHRSLLHKQLWLKEKLVLIWDVADKRGWLVNGATALLYLVKASLEYNRIDDPSRDDFIFEKEDLLEPKRSTPKSAHKVLRNKDNLELKLYRDDEETFQDRVDLFLNVLEKMIEHQQQICGDEGVDMASIPRKYLEGWDFYDLIKVNNNRIYSCMATLESDGKSWVDLLRSLHTVTLFGRGFGELIKPINPDSCQNCQSWTELPKNKYYISCCVADLRSRINTVYPEDGHTRIGRRLIWHTETTFFDSCICDDMMQDHHEPVQSILHSSMSDSIPLRDKAIMTDSEGAVIFGQHSKSVWIWGNEGHPQNGRPSLCSNRIEETSRSDSGIGSSIGSSSKESSMSSTTSNTGSEPTPSTMKDSRSNAPISGSKYCPDPDSFRIGIICALSKELKAVRALYDRTYNDPAIGPGDEYRYAAGRMGEHLVVSSCLPAGEYGTNSAADCASNMKRSFPNIKFCLLVGIGGGIPSATNDIRLGDVVVSFPDGLHPGVIQYDRGKDYKNGDFQRTGVLHGPPRLLLNAIGFLRSNLCSPSDTLQHYIKKISDQVPPEERAKYRHQGGDSDILYEKECPSGHGPLECTCSNTPLLRRDPRPTDKPVIHYGAIGSGNRVIKNAWVRDDLGGKEDVLCVEMEAAGVMNTLPTLVIRGICDYSDSQKNKLWQEYAAATAAAYARILLDEVAPIGQSVGSAKRRSYSPLEDDRQIDLPDKRRRQFL